MAYSDASDASTSSSKDSNSAQVLQTGLAALKRNDAAGAIAALETCLQSSHAATRLKAQMGLIKAYRQIGQPDLAIDLCQPLVQHSHPQVQAWAKQTLQELRSDFKPNSVQHSSPDHSSLDHSSLEHPAPNHPTRNRDQTGFAPIVDHSTEASDATGFAPIVPPTSPRPQLPVNPVPVRPPRSRPAAAIPKPSSPEVNDLELNQTQTDRDQTQQAQSELNANSAVDSQPLLGAATSGALATAWRNAGRATQWSTLGKIDASGLWALEVGSIALLFWLLRSLLEKLFGFWNGFSIRVSWITDLPRLILPTQLSGIVLITLLVLLLTSPWLIDKLLQSLYQGQPLSLSQLDSFSPEASRLLRRLCQSHRQPVPQLRLIPNSEPLSFSYGYLPQNARIAVSQGLLNQLNNDEIAALLAAELAHIRYWDFGILSTIVFVAQIPYRLYWSIAVWGDRQHDRVLITVAVIISSIGYGVFWLLRLSGLWLSRVRLYYSDRQAADWTGNPNGVARALLKVAIGTAQTIQQQKQTSALLESFELLSPVGYRSALTIGSLYDGTTTLFDWDRANPDRRWLILNNSHPTLGERLALLMQYGQRWRLLPEVEFTAVTKLPHRIGRQGAPFWGVPIGFGVALLFWGVGWLGQKLRWFEIAWLKGDWSIVLACCLLGFSIGMILRINSFFPDIKSTNLQVDPDLSRLLSDPQTLPIDSQPVRIQGTLLGRSGLLNWLYQDLLLQTSTGLIRLHYTSKLGWIGDLFPQTIRPTAVIDRSVTVTGWFRRGATVWIDVDMIQTEYGRKLRSNHPIWSTILACGAALLAVLIIFGGGR